MLQNSVVNTCSWFHQWKLSNYITGIVLTCRSVFQSIDLKLKIRTWCDKLAWSFPCSKVLIGFDHPMVLLLDCIGKRKDTSTCTSETCFLSVFNSCAPRSILCVHALKKSISTCNAIFFIGLYSKTWIQQTHLQ